MFENPGEIVILVLAVVVTWVAARATADAGGSVSHNARFGPRFLPPTRRTMPFERRPHRAGVTVPADGDEPEYDHIRLIEKPDVARTA